MKTRRRRKWWWWWWKPVILLVYGPRASQLVENKTRRNASPTASQALIPLKQIGTWAKRGKWMDLPWFSSCSSSSIPFLGMWSKAKINSSLTLSSLFATQASDFMRSKARKEQRGLLLCFALMNSHLQSDLWNAIYMWNEHNPESRVGSL